MIVFFTTFHLHLNKICLINYIKENFKINSRCSFELSVVNASFSADDLLS